MEFIKKNVQKIGFLAVLLMFIGNFLPFITSSASLFGVSASESYTLLSEDIRVIGIIAIVLEVIMAVLVLKNKQKLTLIPTIIILIALLLAKSTFSGLNFGFGSVGYDIGFYVILIGCIIGIVYAFLKGEPKDTVTKSE